MRRSRRARRWSLTVPWGEPARLTVPRGMDEDEIALVIDAHRAWIDRERAKQVPRLGLDGRGVSEEEARAGARELVTMLAAEEAAALGVSYERIAIRDQRTRWGSCSPRSTCSTTSSSTSSATCASRTTRRGSGGSSRAGGPAGGRSATGSGTSGPSCSRFGRRRREQTRA